jgi:hypothetical protein
MLRDYDAVLLTARFSVRCGGRVCALSALTPAIDVYTRDIDGVCLFDLSPRET